MTNHENLKTSLSNSNEEPLFSNLSLEDLNSINNDLQGIV